jgi:hypothetical protein
MEKAQRTKQHGKSTKNKTAWKKHKEQNSMEKAPTPNQFKIHTIR